MKNGTEIPSARSERLAKANTMVMQIIREESVLPRFQLRFRARSSRADFYLTWKKLELRPTMTAYQEKAAPMLSSRSKLHSKPENSTKKNTWDSVVIFKTGSETRDIPCAIGVKQGDNMASILFIYLMNAFTETLSDK
eukprot:scaffold162830_cov52-Attheya_sp.AAC.3